MSSGDFNNLSLRKTTSYNPDGSFVSTGYVFTVGTQGAQSWTNNLNLNTLMVSTLSTQVMTVNSTLVTSTLTTQNVTFSTLIGSTLSVNNAAATNISNNVFSGSSLTVSTIGVNTLNTSSLTATNISNNVFLGSSLIVSTIQANTITTSTANTQNVTFSTQTGSTLTANTMTLTSTLYVSSIVMGGLTFSTITGNMMITNNLIVNSTITTSTINGSTGIISSFQTVSGSFSTLNGSTINVNTIQANSSITTSSLMANQITVNSTATISSLTTQFSNFVTLQGSTLNISTIQANSSITTSSLTANLITVNSTATISSLTTQFSNFVTLQGSTLNISTIQANSSITTSSLRANQITVNSTATISSLTTQFSNFVTLQGSTLNISTIQANSSITTSSLAFTTLSGPAGTISSLQTVSTTFSTLVGSTISTNFIVVNSTIYTSSISTIYMSVSTLMVSSIMGPNGFGPTGPGGLGGSGGSGTGGIGGTGYTGPIGVTGPLGAVSKLSYVPTTTQTITPLSTNTLYWSTPDLTQSTGSIGITYSASTGLFTNSTLSTLPLLVEYSVLLSTSGGGSSFIGIGGTTNMYGAMFNAENNFSNSYTILLSSGTTMGVYYNDNVSTVVSTAITRLSITNLTAGAQGPTGFSVFGNTAAAGPIGTVVTYTPGFMGLGAGPSGTSFFNQTTNGGSTAGTGSIVPQCALDVQGALRAGAHVFADSSVSVTAQLPLDYMTFGVNWTQTPLASSSWYAASMSATGEFQTATNLAVIWMSANYGQTWTSVQTIANVGPVAVSGCGQYQIAATYVAGGVLWTSYTMGASWIQVPSSPTGQWTSVAISSSGQFMVACNGTAIWYSTNYGATWLQASASSLSYTSITMSASGQYQVVGSSGNSVYYSSNYGLSWSTSNATNQTWTSVSMSATGQYAFATSNVGYVYYSTNYGQTWIQSASISGNWLTIRSVASGQYLVACTSTAAYYSNNYGIQWTSAQTVSNSSSVAVCSTGQYLLAMGNTGNVFLSVTYYPALTVYGSSTTNGPGSGVFNVINSSTSASNTIVNFLQPAVPTAGLVYSTFGRSATAYNSFAFGFGYVGIGSTTNYLNISAYGQQNGLSIGANGYVGIGIGNTAPLNALTVSGLGANYVKPLIVVDAGIAGNSSTGAPRGIGQPLIGIGNTSYTSGNVAGDYYGIGFGFGGGNAAGVYYPAEIGLYVQSTSGAEYGDLVFSTRATTTNTSAAPERMRITSSGNVGIGTNNPGTKLDVNGGLNCLTAFTISSAYPSTNGHLRFLSASGTNYIQSGLAPTLGSAADIVFSNMNYGTEWMRITSSGSVGIGITAVRGTRAMDIAGAANFPLTNAATQVSISDSANIGMNLLLGSYYVNSTNSYSSIQSSLSGVGQINLVLNPAGGNVGIGTSNPNGNLHVYSTSGIPFIIYGSNAAGSNSGIFQVFNPVNGAGGWGGSNSILYLTKETSTGRSINAAGTINASGTDYAEYMYKSDNFIINKGDIIGINSNGLLTNQYDQSVTFMIKSTNPSFIGGDTWGIEDVIGKKPETPVENATVDVKSAYQQELAVWEAALETERQKVDRIAFSGQVPVNVQGAIPGNYIIPIRNADGMISGQSIAKEVITFQQYQQVVGTVIKILEDGRAFVIV